MDAPFRRFVLRTNVVQRNEVVRRSTISAARDVTEMITLSDVRSRSRFRFSEQRLAITKSVDCAGDTKLDLRDMRSLNTTHD
jgi:hypothetical protein